MKRLYYLLSLCLALSSVACKTAKPTSGTDANPRITGSNNSPQSYYDNARRTVAPAAVAEISADPEYGFTQKKPVCVGGTSADGVRNQQSYLNALRGPKGEDVSYRRRGSCCPFKTPHGLINNMGMLDIYELNWAGNEKPLIIYVNLYDEGPLRAPIGLTLTKP